MDIIITILLIVAFAVSFFAISDSYRKSRYLSMKTRREIMGKIDENNFAATWDNDNKEYNVSPRGTQANSGNLAYMRMKFDALAKANKSRAKFESTSNGLKGAIVDNYLPEFDDLERQKMLLDQPLVTAGKKNKRAVLNRELASVIQDNINYWQDSSELVTDSDGRVYWQDKDTSAQLPGESLSDLIYALQSNSNTKGWKLTTNDSEFNEPAMLWWNQNRKEIAVIVATSEVRINTGKFGKISWEPTTVKSAIDELSLIQP